MTRQIEAIYKGGTLVLPHPLEDVSEGDKVRISLLNIVRAIPEADEDPDALARAIARLTRRTPEEIEATRARLVAEMEPPRPLPLGQTLEDVICGQWPGPETDEEVLQALGKLS